MPELSVDEFNSRVGAIVMNLQALETTIRFFFFRKNSEMEPFPKACGPTEVPSTSLTTYCQLRKWIRKYNSALSKQESEFAISEESAEIRDAIAHGRLIAPDPPSLPFTMWKFGETVNGMVPVRMCRLLTREWLDQTVREIGTDKDKVIKCFKSRKYQGLSFFGLRDKKAPPTSEAGQ
jgi:hypothetical protein